MYKDKECTQVHERKFHKLKFTNQRAKWQYWPNREPVTLDNGITYDVGKIEDLIEKKHKFMKRVVMKDEQEEQEAEE